MGKAFRNHGSLQTVKRESRGALHHPFPKPRGAHLGLGEATRRRLLRGVRGALAGLQAAVEIVHVLRERACLQEGNNITYVNKVPQHAFPSGTVATHC